MGIGIGSQSGEHTVLAQALLELNPQSYSTQNIEEVPYISLDEFLSSDSEEIKTTSKHNQDLCMRIDDNATQQLEEGTKTVINLQPPPPHNNGQPQLNHLNLTEKLSSAARNTGVQNLMRNISFTPSPSSSSSFDNEEDMGCVGPPPFTIYRKNPAPVKLNFRESALINNRLSVSSPMTEGSDEDLEMQSSISFTSSTK